MLEGLARTPGDESDRLRLTTMALHDLGRTAQADAALQALISLNTADGSCTECADVAMALAWCGNSSAAFDWLERLAERRDPRVPVEIRSYEFNKVRTGPRLVALLRKMNLPVR